MLDIAKFFRFSWEWFEKKNLATKFYDQHVLCLNPKPKVHFQHKAYIPINPFSKLLSQAAQP